MATTAQLVHLATKLVLLVPIAQVVLLCTRIVLLVSTIQPHYKPLVSPVLAVSTKAALDKQAVLPVHRVITVQVDLQVTLLVQLDSTLPQVLLAVPVVVLVSTKEVPPRHPAVVVSVVNIPLLVQVHVPHVLLEDTRPVLVSHRVLRALLVTTVELLDCLVTLRARLVNMLLPLPPLHVPAVLLVSTKPVLGKLSALLVMLDLTVLPLVYLL